MCDDMRPIIHPYIRIPCLASVPNLFHFTAVERNKSNMCVCVCNFLSRFNHRRTSCQLSDVHIQILYVWCVCVSQGTELWADFL